ncbi:cation:proton antiporter [Thermococcus gammatolerans]|uniref:Na+/H+ antiporter n=1 Tax=Thermococcus gammatolerans (strain DSM 15229 / JCM 11827 / EJ3) TaxID=593117 RepID=C5A4C0_THEGJ|nr:cation:proton antiporter [Thermococcus gammatolerans]ACS33082.1 Na+/H+ antiporter [Thermococcus gammatolerans EJ3]
MQVIGYVLIIIALGRFLAELFERIGYPGIVGEITAGLLLGYFLRDVPAGEMNLLAEFGIFFLMILAGLEITPDELRMGGREALPVYLVTLAVMFFVTLPFTNYSISTGNILAASILAVASAPIVVRIKRFFGEEYLHVALSYAIISEVVILVLVYVLASFEEAHDPSDLAITIVKQVLFIGGVLYVNYKIGIQHKIWLITQLRRLRSDEAVFGAFMILAATLGFISEEVGMHFTIGAFLAGLLLHSDLVGTRQYERLETILSGVTYGIFAPIFFAWRGMNFRAEVTLATAYFFLAIYLVRFLLTVVLTWDGRLLSSIAKATGLVSFGILGLLVSDLGNSYGVLTGELYSISALTSIGGIFLAATIGRGLSFLRRSSGKGL